MRYTSILLHYSIKIKQDSAGGGAFIKIAGIVAEYNPFHSGHQWQIAETRRQGATHVVAVMSGCFTQRGEPALWDKWTRTRGALLGGADLVLELPLPYAMATAERFAFGAVSILDSLGVCDLLSFGCECGDAAQLDAAVAALTDLRVAAKIGENMTTGITYAVARQQAVAAGYGDVVAGLLGEPNNILAIEYLLWLKKLGSKMRPMALLRQGAAHDSPKVGQYASASAIRELFAEGDVQAENWLTEPVYRLYHDAWAGGECFDRGSFDRPVLAALRRLSPQQIKSLPDVAEGLENRIYQAIRTAESLEGLLGDIKTKRYSHARLRRILLAGWLGVPGTLVKEPPPYVRVLGMNGHGKEILGAVGNGGTLPISHSLVRLAKLGERERDYTLLEAGADDLYATVTKKIQPCGKDYTQQPCICGIIA